MTVLHAANIFVVNTCMFHLSEQMNKLPGMRGKSGSIPFPVMSM